MRWPASLLANAALFKIVLAFRPEAFSDTVDDLHIAKAQPERRQVAAIAASSRSASPAIDTRPRAERRPGHPHGRSRRGEDEAEEEDDEGSGDRAVVQVMNSAHMRWAGPRPQDRGKRPSDVHHHHANLVGGAHSGSSHHQKRPVNRSVSSMDSRARVVTEVSGLSQGRAAVDSESSTARRKAHAEQQQELQRSVGGAVGGAAVHPWSDAWEAERRRVEVADATGAALASAAGAVGGSGESAVGGGKRARRRGGGGVAAATPNSSATPNASSANDTATQASSVNASSVNASKPVVAPTTGVTTLDASNAGKLIIKGLETRNLSAVRSYLRAVDALLEHDPKAFDPNAMVPLDWHTDTRERSEKDVTAGNATQAQSWTTTNTGAASNISASTTLLAFVARSGWLPGVEELVEWDKSRMDAGGHLQIDEPGGKLGPYSSSPLSLSIEAGHVDVAAYLLQHGASVAVRNFFGKTPLEIAAFSGSWELTSVLLESGTMLSGGLLTLRLHLLEEAESLPKLEGRWAQMRQRKDAELEHMRNVVPPAFRPSPDELAAVGDLPSAWILLYKSKVMCAFANGVFVRNKPARRTEILLVNHNFDSFARDYSMSCVILSCILGIFGLMTYIAFRIRVYGWCETPVSLADFIPGAFDPLRLADPDFDPSRHKTRLPYLTAKEYLGPQVSSCLVVVSAFAQAWLGIFSSWLLQFVRIPPEKDPYDEDYLSDDDDDCRSRVRDLCILRAQRVRCLEVSARILGFAVLMMWLVLRAGRWGEAVVLALLYFFYAWVASSVAGSAVPAPPIEPEKTPDDSDSRREEALDSARVVHALFSVQHGPRWTRTICSTRSTATPSNNTKSKLLRRRHRRQQQLQHSHPSGFETDRSGSEAGNREGAAGLGGTDAPNVLEADETAFSDWFQRTFLQSGLLHIQHGSVLAFSLVSICLVGIALLWLAHVRRLDSGDWTNRYTMVSPVQLVEAYGLPGSLTRCLAITLELLLLWFAGERIYGIVSLLQVVANTLQQRKEAIRFARKHQPTIYRKNPDEALSVKGATIAVEECVRCFDFAHEISAVRWAVLREPTLIVYLCTLIFILVALLHLAAPLAGMAWVRSWSALDPMVPLCFALCLTLPLVSLLLNAAAANREVTQQREHIRQATDAAVTIAASLGKEADDVEYVQLRVKSCEALQHSFLRWPGGRQLGMAEPVLFLCLLAAACGLGLTLGNIS